MDVTTANRFHIGEIFFSSLFRIPLIALLGIYLWELVLYETLMFAVVQFHHTNIDISENVDRMLRAVIVSPNMHRVHHSRWQPETDSNYSSLFSFWDRLARTFRYNPHPENIELGLDEFDREDDQTVGGMLKTPILKQKRNS
jgi:sterol desaturase/sphingolipid hydroxylase (fatty acid hydroxylase superfamily)